MTPSFEILCNSIEYCLLHRELSKGSKLPSGRVASDSKKVRELQAKLDKMSEQLQNQEKIGQLEKPRETGVSVPGVWITTSVDRGL